MAKTLPYDIEISRAFDAPRERVYRAFTDPDLFAAWYGPPGFRWTVPQSISTRRSAGGSGSPW
ncbi:MAG: SRPBCC domain-containing protein [Acidimicrobiales bacterium]